MKRINVTISDIKEFVDKLETVFKEHSLQYCSDLTILKKYYGRECDYAYGYFEIKYYNEIVTFDFCTDTGTGVQLWNFQGKFDNCHLITKTICEFNNYLRDQQRTS